MANNYFVHLLTFLPIIIILLICDNLDIVEGLVRKKRIVGGTEAPAPPVDDPVVFVIKDESEARVFGTKDKVSGYYQFRGVRYAEPPVGNRRFQRPVMRYLQGDVVATDWGAPCLQPSAVNGAGVIGSEDCLFLNVFTPALPDATDGHPVLVWIHGGGFRRGASTQYEVRPLVDKNTIVVSIQYRLGSLGFLSDGTRDLSGNNGLFDMMLATEWVRNYIEFFGGNPNKIVAFGQGIGASSAFMLGLSKFGQDHYSGLIGMSGSMLSHYAVDREPRTNADALAESNNCSNNETVELVRCLRSLPASNLVEHDSKREQSSTKIRNFVTDLSTLLGAGPVVDGQNDLRSLPNFVTDEPENLLTEENLPEIPLLTGVVKDETGGAVHGPYKDEITKILSSVPDFLSKNLLPNLQKVVPIIGGISQQFVPEAFAKYISPFTGEGAGKSSKTDVFSKITQAMNDAIFNVPAFLTVKNWSKRSKAFLYSFDHDSKLGFGKDFLSGLAFVGDSAETGKTSHGDDLGYIFNPNDIAGQPMDKSYNFTEDDERVRDFFTDLIVGFARNGNVTFKAKSENANFSPISLPSFKGNDDDDDDTYLSITSKPTVSNKFRFCEMGLWTGALEKFKSSACSLLYVDLKQPLKTVQKAASSISNLPKLAKVGEISDFLNIKPVPKPFKVPGIPKVPNLNPLSNNKQKEKNSTEQNETTKSPKSPVPKNPFSKVIG